MMTANDSLSYTDIYRYLPDTSRIDTLPLHFAKKAEVLLPIIKKSPFISDWIIIVFVLSVIILITVRLDSGKYFYHLIQSIFNSQTASRLYREKLFNFLHPAFRLEILYYFTFGLFLFQVEKTFLEIEFTSDWILYLINTTFIIVFINLKNFLFIIAGFIFNVQNEVDEYIFYTRSGNHVMGLFLLPISVLFSFFEWIWLDILLILGIVIILSFSITSLFKGIKIIAQKDFSISYLILYLCSLEILPLLLVWKILWRM